jgi:hypothetical protein
MNEMEINMNLKRLLLANAVALALAACGGGGASTSTAPDTVSLRLQGTAATGLAIGGAAILAKCQTGVGAATTNIDGSYTLNVAGGVLPCVLEVASAVNGLRLHSIANGSGNAAVANVTPLSELLAARLLRTDMTTFFAAFDGTRLTQAATSASIKVAQDEVALVLAGSIDTSAVSDFLKTPLRAASPGNLSAGDAQDKLLDTLKTTLNGAQYAQVLTVLEKAAPPPNGAATGANGAFVPILNVKSGPIILVAGGTYVFDAAINYPDGVYYIRQPVHWEVVEPSGGTISLNGVYTAPQTPGLYHVKVQRDDYPAISKIIDVVVAPNLNTQFIPTLTLELSSARVASGTVLALRAGINYPLGVAYIREPVSWRVVEADGGTISLNGLYAAPLKTGVFHLMVTRDDFPALSAVVEVTVY